VTAIIARGLTGALLALVLAGCSSSSGPELAEGPLPGTSLTPYVDMSTDAPPDLAAVAAATGQRDYVFAFALAQAGACRPAWGGLLPIDTPSAAAQSTALRGIGGRVTVATGGALGPYLENACPTPEALAGAYGEALDAAGASALDVDIEADVPADRVASALGALQRERGTPISVTLPVANAQNALTPQAMALLRAIAAEQVAVRINVMAMNFPDPGGWAAAMVSAADATAHQLAEVWPSADPAALRRRVGVTVMIGRNDQGMVTTLDDAATVAEAARGRGFGAVGMWSVGRDDGCPGQEVAQPDCSGVAQEPLAFLRTLRSSFAP
jgi:chitinase